MSYRFRRSVKLAPGIRMNFSGSGVSWTLGPRGASVGIGKRGTYLNTGIPGTGLYSRQRLGGSTAAGRRTQSHTQVTIKVGINDEGVVHFEDEYGNPLSEKMILAAKRQQGDAIRDLLQKKCDEINSQIEAVDRIHTTTPNPTLKPHYDIESYPDPEPLKPRLKPPSFFVRMFKGLRNRHEAKNSQKTADYERSLGSWQAQKARFDAEQAARKRLLEDDIYNNVVAMEGYLEERLHQIDWPRETNVSHAIYQAGTVVFIDVDLPEIEDMPNKMASVPQRGLKLSVKEIPVSKIQRSYMQHVHAVGFRIIGEAFSALPVAQEVVLSAFSQRLSSATGQVTDEYLYSVKVDRIRWQGLNFANLEAVDPVDSLSQWEIKRNMTKTGLFKPITPFAPPDPPASASDVPS